MRMTLTAAFAAASLIALAGCKQTTVAGNEAAANESANAAAPAAAGSIDGTWKADIDSVQFSQKPDEFLLQEGQYSCKSCVPSFTVAADGAFHPVSLPYADSYAVKVVDDHNIVRTQKKGGRQVGETKVMVSADGNTLTFSSKPGPGPQFRLIYKKNGSDTFTVSFEIAPAGQPGAFKPYTSGKILRAGK